MGSLNVKNGTPVGSKHLCKRCTWGQFMTGYRDSDLLVICTRTEPNFTVPFTMYECSEFMDKNKPSWEQMKNLAIHVNPGRVVSARTKGFYAVTKVKPAREDQEKDEGEETRAV
jgi:hypothetical protein